jgi:hypothetical protein
MHMKMAPSLHTSCTSMSSVNASVAVLRTALARITGINDDGAQINEVFTRDDVNVGIIAFHPNVP